MMRNRLDTRPNSLFPFGNRTTSNGDLSFRFMKGVLNIQKASVYEKSDRVFCGGGYKVKKDKGKSLKGMAKGDSVGKLGVSVKVKPSVGVYSSISNLSLTRSSNNFPISPIFKDDN